MSDTTVYMKKMFEEANGTFSWRKALTALSGLVFTAACIVNLSGGPVLDSQYLMIIAGVFTFYFFKDKMSGQSAVSLAQTTANSALTGITTKINEITGKTDESVVENDGKLQN